MNGFRKFVKKIKNYEEAIGVLGWDMRTGAPKKGMDSRSEVIGMLSTEMFKMQISDEMEHYIETYTQPEAFAKLDQVNRKLITECKKEFDRSRKIPTELYEEYVILASKSESIWEEAKDQSDFARFQPYLE